MDLKERVKTLLLSVLADDESLFLIELSTGSEGRIKVVLDSDSGISLKDCVSVSKALERKMEEEELDLALEVSSPGASSPLLVPRQYKKHIGRKLKVRTAAGEHEGVLTEVSDEQIRLEWKAREPKPVGKGKVTVQKKLDIMMSDIEESKVIVTF